MEIKSVISKFIYHIEPKPEGGFIAKCSDSSLPPLEAQTRAELQQQIQARISAEIASRFPGLQIPQSNETKFSWHIEAKPNGGFVAHSSDPALESIEGKTKEEVEKWLIEKAATLLEKKLPSELAEQLKTQAVSVNLNVVITTRRVSVGGKTSSQTVTLDNAKDSLLPSVLEAIQSKQIAGNASPIISNTTSISTTDLNNTSPLTPVSNSSSFFRFLVAALVVLGLLFFFLHAKR